MPVHLTTKFRYGNLSITIPACTLPSRCPYVSYVIHRPNLVDYSDLRVLESQLRAELERLRTHLAAGGENLSLELRAETEAEYDALRRVMQRLGETQG